jgi:hypothetical protein
VGIDPRRWFQACLAISLAACSHTEPYTTVPQGGQGPFRPGSPALVSVSPGSWTQDGRGIVIQGTCLDSSRAGRGMSALRILPAQGGSAVLELCEDKPAIDSMGRFVAPAVARDGRLLYVEAVGPLSTKLRPWPFPLRWHAELWLADTSSAPFPGRRLLMNLWGDHPALPLVPPTTTNWIADIAWIGPDDFIALAQSLQNDGGIGNPRLAHGVIAADGARLTTLPGTGKVKVFAVAAGGTLVVFIGDSFNISRVAVSGGPITTVATFPAAAVVRVVDVSCHDDFCIVLTNDPAPANLPRSTLWRLTLSNGQLLPIQSFQDRLGSAKLSPVSGDVLMFGSGGLSLYTDLVH